jgi:hypothetical protein
MILAEIQLKVRSASYIYQMVTTNHLVLTEGQSLLPYKKQKNIKGEVTLEDHAVEEESEIVTKVDDTIFKASSSTSTSKKLPMVSLVIHHSTYAL